MVGEVRPSELGEILSRHGRGRVELDRGCDALSEIGVGPRDHGCVSDRGVAQKCRLDVGAGDVLAAADDDVLGAAGHVQEAILDAPKVACMYPAFAIDDVGLALTPVPDHLSRRADQDLALTARLRRVDSKFGHGRRFAGCPGMLGHHLSRRGGDSAAGLGHSVDRRKPAIGSGESAPEPRSQLWLNRSTPK